MFQVRVRLECQRLLEDNRDLRGQMDKLKLYSNPRKHIMLEKEIDQLKWQLTQVKQE